MEKARNVVHLENLGGYSGCSIYKVITDFDFIYVSKSSSSITYNERFKIQLLKQSSFSNLFSGSNLLAVPEIYIQDVGDDGILYCEMQYVPSKERITNRLSDILPLLIDYFHVARHKKPIELCDLSFQDCLKPKMRNISKMVPSTLNKLITESLYSIRKLNLPQSFCHGDLTLENLILSIDRKLYFIDFLDSFYPTVWLDYAKLYQEIEAGWSNIRNGKICDAPNPCYRTFRFEMNNWLNIHDAEYCKYHYFFLALCLLRIIPYTKQEEIYNALCTKSKLYLKKFLNGELLKNFA
ncbi:MAG: phosphotransferase [Clostridiales bacterium]|jgi:hypothetical protein|nr:phosphotransferase [Clostridiales bacterium]